MLTYIYQGYTEPLGTSQDTLSKTTNECCKMNFKSRQYNYGSSVCHLANPNARYHPIATSLRSGIWILNETNESGQKPNQMKTGTKWPNIFTQADYSTNTLRF